MSDYAKYHWRRLTDVQRREVLEDRKNRQLPWHSPPHYSDEHGLYMITAACYEHRCIIGLNHQRMADFEEQLLCLWTSLCSDVFAWTVLPNHYHALVKTNDIDRLLYETGRLHGRTSFKWNGEDDRRGRKVWCNATETAMKSDRHFWTSFIYVLHNSVKHGYVKKWQDWPFCNAMVFFEQAGRERTMRLWQDYPIYEYGAVWDPADM